MLRVLSSSSLFSPKIEPFEEYASRYEKWFEIHPAVYQSELEAIRSILPKFKQGFEIGVGTGRFSQPFGIQNGIEPARNALKVAQTKGIEVIDGVGEALPYRSQSFDLALIVTTICFLSDVSTSLNETFRVLRPSGWVVIGFVDKDSPLGRTYLERREENPFYRSANFYRTKEVVRFLLGAGFGDPILVQSVFKSLKETKEVEPVKQGYGEGSFVVVRARKPD
jgi:SAM-dependent methyltransferase